MLDEFPGISTTLLYRVDLADDVLRTCFVESRTKRSSGRTTLPDSLMDGRTDDSHAITRDSDFQQCQLFLITYDNHTTSQRIGMYVPGTNRYQVHARVIRSRAPQGY